MRSSERPIVDALIAKLAATKLELARAKRNLRVARASRDQWHERARAAEWALRRKR